MEANTGTRWVFRRDLAGAGLEGMPGLEGALAELERVGDLGEDVSDAYLVVEDGRVTGVGGWPLWNPDPN